MKITYDKEVDAIYLKLSGLKPDGVIEVAEGINIDVTDDGKIVGIELLDATKKMGDPIGTIIRRRTFLKQDVALFFTGAFDRFSSFGAL